MIIDVYSDLHLDTWKNAMFDSVRPEHFDPSPDADVVVVAGDQGNGQGWSTFCRKLMHEAYGDDAKIFIINGNHDWYTKAGAPGEASDLIDANTLGRLVCNWDGVKIIGCTLWTNFWGSDADGFLASRNINDFMRIPGLIFDHKPMVEMHNLDVEFLRANDADVIVTHFPPSLRSIHPSYQGDPLNPYFVNDLEELIHELSPKLWIHGHTHNGFDYMVGKTRVVSNPLGYPGERQSLPPFRPMRIEV